MNILPQCFYQKDYCKIIPSLYYGIINCRFKETITVLDAKQSMYMLKGNNLKARV